MKKFKTFSIGCLGLIFLIFLIGSCSSNNSNDDKGINYKKLTVYPVTIKKINSDKDGNLIIKGTTEAPKGAKIIAQSTIKDEESSNEAMPHDIENDGYEKVKKGSFVIEIHDLLDLVQSDSIKLHQELKFKILAVTGYHEKFDDYTITYDLRKAIKKANIKTTTFKADKNIVNYWKDDSDTSNDEDDSKEDNNDISDSSNSDNADEDKTSKSTNSSKKSKSTTNTTKANMALEILQKNYADKAKVEYNKAENMFTILPTVDGYDDVIQEAADGDTSDWHRITDSIDEVSRSLYDDVKLKTPVSLLNPSDPDKVLYTSIDGTSAYDFSDN